MKTAFEVEPKVCEACEEGEHEYCENPARIGPATFASGGVPTVDQCCCPEPEGWEDPRIEREIERRQYG